MIQCRWCGDAKTHDDVCCLREERDALESLTKVGPMRLLTLIDDLAAALKSADETCSRLHDLVWQHQQQCGAFREVRPNDLIWLIHDTLRAALGKVEGPA